jgi:protein-tyrosine-phosphatase
MPLPLFVCHANCCRSAMAQYLYENLNPGTFALSAGVEPGEVINEKALGMLRIWGIDASDHQPRRLDRSLCQRADAIFVMGPEYLHRILSEYGPSFAKKSYLFADPFTLPISFLNGAYMVRDPSFDPTPSESLIPEFSWFRERVVQIHGAMNSEGKVLVPASQYMPLLE